MTDSHPCLPASEAYGDPAKIKRHKRFGYASGSLLSSFRNNFGSGPRAWVARLAIWLISYSYHKGHGSSLSHPSRYGSTADTGT